VKPRASVDLVCRPFLPEQPHWNIRITCIAWCYCRQYHWRKKTVILCCFFFLKSTEEIEVIENTEGKSLTQFPPPFFFSFFFSSFLLSVVLKILTIFPSEIVFSCSWAWPCWIMRQWYVLMKGAVTQKCSVWWFQMAEVVIYFPIASSNKIYWFYVLEHFKKWMAFLWGDLVGKILN